MHRLSAVAGTNSSTFRRALRSPALPHMCPSRHAFTGTLAADDLLWRSSPPSPLPSTAWAASAQPQGARPRTCPFLRRPCPTPPPPAPPLRQDGARGSPPHHPLHVPYPQPVSSQKPLRPSSK